MNTETDSEFDVVIVGGGMVGSLLCAALASPQSNDSDSLKVCVLEERMPEPFEPNSDTPYDLRVSALSVASQHMLESVAAWDGIVARRCCVYKRLSVWDGELNGRTDFSAADIRADHLGHIVENRVIQLALLDAIKKLPNVTLLSPARLGRYHSSTTGVKVTLEDGRELSARLLVGADGANSIVRRQAGINMERKAYPQHALVATIGTQQPQQDITWQRFVPSGPQAFLPLCEHQGSIVWYNTEEEVQRIRELNDEAFIDCLQQAFPAELGLVESVHARGSFPIAKSHAHNYISNRVALVGDAAHTVHPLAGQGVNIGLLDAAALAQVLRNASSVGRDIGAHPVLRRYQRWRYGDNQLMITALDAIYEAFKPRPTLVKQARSASLNLVDQLTPLKHQVMRHAMGIAGDLPSIAKPR